MENRREFIKLLTSMTLGLGIAGTRSVFASESGVSDRLGQLLPLRPLGKTGLKVTMLGMGGFHLGCAMTEKEAQKTIETALEGGVRFFDCAQAYCEGNTEKRIGKLLTPKYREDIFLMTKTLAPSADEARRSLEESLRSLKTDYLDLWQVHSVKTVKDVDNRVQNGVLEVMMEAREKGIAKSIGFTGHVHPEVLRRMLEHTDIFECCQLPVNAVDPNHASFITGVMPELIKREMGIIVIKSLGGGSFFGSSPRLPGWNVEDPVIPARISVREALDFVWSLPVSTLVTGAENAEMLQEKIDLANNFVPMEEEKRHKIIEYVADMVGIAESNYKSDQF
jgi:predicted aldo/keto reductase-like oxidoreductase